jgi:DNA-binding CsgD family transcriptional regulator
MDAVAAATASAGALLLPLRGRSPGVPFSLRIASAVEAYVSEGWMLRDERDRGASAMMRRGAYSDLDFTTPDEIARHPYYQDFLARHDLRWFAGVKVEFGEELWCLSIQRTIGQGPFSAAEVRRLARLSDSLASAGALARALGFARADAAVAAFEASGLAVALIDRFGRAFRLNVAAEALLGNDLNVAEGRLKSFDHDATQAFDRALHALFWSGASLMPPVALPRREKRALLAYPLRPPAICADALAACQAVVVLIDPDERPQPQEAHVRTAFGLSPAEARLAVRLASGERLEHAAEALGVTYETARTELKRVFAKTEVSRQSELVALLSRLRMR